MLLNNTLYISMCMNTFQTYPFFSVTSLRRKKKKVLHIWKHAAWWFKAAKAKVRICLLIKQGLDFELVVKLLQFHQKPEPKGNETETGSWRSPTDKHHLTQFLRFHFIWVQNKEGKILILFILWDEELSLNRKNPPAEPGSGMYR